jgi:5'-phosphate synthase pdxT subunit
LILLAESANKTKKGGQELIGGLDVRVNRNHFGRQTESFVADLELPFLSDLSKDSSIKPEPFNAVFIRAPVVERILSHAPGIQEDEAKRADTVVAPSRKPEETVPKAILSNKVEVMATVQRGNDGAEADIIAVRQGNCFGTSFHPELTNDPRIHLWWLNKVLDVVNQ